MQEYIEIKIAGIKVRIEAEDPTEDIYGVIDALIEPALQALGFQQKTIDEVLINKEGE